MGSIAREASESARRSKHPFSARLTKVTSQSVRDPSTKAPKETMDTHQTWRRICTTDMRSGQNPHANHDHEQTQQSRNG